MVPGVLGYARFVRGRSRSGMVELILDVFHADLRSRSCVRDHPKKKLTGQ